MAVHRLASGNIDKQDFENHLKAHVRNEGYIEILMHTPDPTVQISGFQSPDIASDICNLNTLDDLNKYTSSTIPTLEENLWVLNGRFIIFQGVPTDGYISNSVSDENGEFSTNPTIRVNLFRPSDIHKFSVVLNPSVPSGYPKYIKLHSYDENDTEIGTADRVNIEYIENGVKKILSTVPSVNFTVNKQNVSYIIIEFGETRFRHRRIRVSTILPGEIIVMNDSQVTNVDFIDKTSYVCDTLPSRVFTFEVNNYDSTFDIDNPNNSAMKLDRNTIVRFRNGYNTFGYEYNDDGTVRMEDKTEDVTTEYVVTDEHGDPVLDENGDPMIDFITTTVTVREDAYPIINRDLGEGESIDWDDWKELRLIDVSSTSAESAVFTCGSLLDVMEEIYTTDIYQGGTRTVGEVVTDILNYEGFDTYSVEWASDDRGIAYNTYTINTPIPEVQCKQVLQLIAFTIGATILIKDNGHIRFANINIDRPASFTNTYQWHYDDLENVPAATQLETVAQLSDISLPKYSSSLDESGDINAIGKDGTTYSHCSVVTTMTCTAVSTEVTYNDCYPIAARLANDNPQTILNAISIANVELYSKRGIVDLLGFATGDEVKIEIIGYPVKTKTTQERNVTSDSLVLDTKIMNYDITANGQSEAIKRKYLEWYKKKFKYTYTGRGEPLVNAGDYGIIQTQFSGEMPVYILQNHWSFDGAWSGDMEVIALDENVD